MKILLTTDGSSNAKEAALFVAKMNFPEQPKVVLLTVSDDRRRPQKTAPGREWNDREVRLADVWQTELEQIFDGRIEYLSKLHRMGNPAQGILKVAKRIDADLIVLGAVGHSLLDRILLGSVSDEVANGAECSVLIVRPPRESTQTTPAKPLRISIAYDGSAAARYAVDELAALEWDDNALVDIVSVAQHYDYMMGDGMTGVVLSQEEELFENMQKSVQQMSRTIAKRLPNARAEVLRGSHVGETIIQYAKSNDTDLLVVGDTGHGQIHELLLGSTTKFMIRHAPCSVWVSRRHHVCEQPNPKVSTAVRQAT